jgi:hypothetical protein
MRKMIWIAAIAQSRLGDAGRHYKFTDVRELVAAGRVFQDDIIHPQEIFSASLVFYVPEGVYDFLSIAVAVPITGRPDAAECVWTLVPKSEEPKRTVYKLKDGRRAEEIIDLHAAFKDPQIQLQTMGVLRQLPLWD